MTRAADAFGAPRPAPPRALTPPERLAGLEVLHGERFGDQAPKTGSAPLLDAGTYLCSWRTMYRVLAAAHEGRERRNPLRPPAYPQPARRAPGPNQVGSGGLTKRLGPVKGVAYALSGVLDIFSRYVVAGWGPDPRTPRWPSGCAGRRASSRPSRRVSGRSMRIGAAR